MKIENCIGNQLAASAGALSQESDRGSDFIHTWLQPGGSKREIKAETV